MVYIVVGALVFVGLCLALRQWFRRRALAIEHADEPQDERLHRLQRLILWQALTLVLLIACAGGALGVVAGYEKHHHASTATKVVTLVAYVVLLVTVALTTRGTVRPSLARVREVPVKPANRKRALAITVPIFFVVGAVMRLAFAFAPKHGPGRALTLVVAYFLVFVVLQSVLAPLLAKAVRARPLPATTAQRLRRLADRMGVRCDVRAFEGRELKVANAAQIGTIPRLRFVMVSDYLLDELSDDEVDAVVAHEFGHLRGRHVLVKLFAVFAVWAVLETGVVLARGTSGVTTVLLLLPLFIGFPVGILLVNGLVGVRLEQKADDVAAEAVGADSLASALTRLSELNHTKRNTGRVWSLLTQHPGVDARIARLRSANPAGSGAAASRR